MKYRGLTTIDIYKYLDDIVECYDSCSLIFDYQNSLRNMTTEGMARFLSNFVEADDSVVVGIFDDNEMFLFGLIIFDNIRFLDKGAAQVHIVNSRDVWGKPILKVYNEIIESCMFDTLYCEIPAIAVGALGMVKRMGFKKTGYIPNALPYKNCKGESKMYDIQIWTWQKEKNKV